jgi:hypothetical protein
MEKGRPNWLVLGSIGGSSLLPPALPNGEVHAPAGHSPRVVFPWLVHALTLNPSNAFGWFWSGFLRLFAGSTETAIEHFEKSLWLDPRTPLRHFYDKIARSGVQLIEQRLRLLQIARVEALSEPAVHRSEQFASLIPLALCTKSQQGPVRLEAQASGCFGFALKSRSKSLRRGLKRRRNYGTLASSWVRSATSHLLAEDYSEINLRFRPAFRNSGVK